MSVGIVDAGDAEVDAVVGAEVGPLTVWFWMFTPKLPSSIERRASVQVWPTVAT